MCQTEHEDSDLIMERGNWNMKYVTVTNGLLEQDCKWVFIYVCLAFVVKFVCLVV